MAKKVKSRRKLIEDTVDDLVSNLLYYDRKEDEELPRGEIEAAIEAGEITVDEIGALFLTALRKGLTE